MRLDVLEHGHGRRNRFALRAMGAVARAEPDDVVKTSLYRPELFGRPWIALLRSTMRGPSPWTPGERELLGAFTSRRNACPYCTAIHSGTASLALGTEVDEAGLDAWREGAFGPRLTAAFALVDTGDVAAARQAGLTDQEIIDAVQVRFVFDVVNRLANALGYSWATEADKQAGIRVLHRLGYRLPAVLLR
jgi:hypothetical protein